MTRLIAASILTISLVTIWAATPAHAAERLATVVRGVGAGADKAAGYLSHHLREQFRKDERYAVVAVGQALGSSDVDQAMQAFAVADEILDKAKESFESLDLDAAVEHLNNALSKYERHAAFVTDFKKIADALMLLGATHVLRGEDRIGSRRLAQAIALYPSVQPDPRIFNPSMREVFERAGRTLVSRPAGDITITSNPSYGEVYVDGQFVGVAPVRVGGISEGRHYVRVARDGYRSWGKLLDVRSGRQTEELANLKRTESFDDFDAMVNDALAVMAKERGDSRAKGPLNDAVDQMGVLLNLDHLILCEVRLDGERVSLQVNHYNLNAQARVVAATASFAYSDDPAAYQREVEALYEAHFKPSPDTEEKYGRESSAGLRHASSAVCGGMPCDTFKTVVLSVTIATGAAMMGVGGILWGLAAQDNTVFEDTPQLADNFVAVRDGGMVKAAVGDALFFAGAAAVTVGAILFFVWQPTPAAEDVVKDSGAFGLFPVVLPGGGGASATLSF